jgi:hypothetical protein
MLRLLPKIRPWCLSSLVMALWVAAGLEPVRGQDRDAPVRFKQMVVEDATLMQPAFTMLIPSDWKGEGAIMWRQHPFIPATGAFVATKPGSAEQIVLYPHVPFVDGIRQSAAETAAIAGPEAMRFAAGNFPEGGKYMGNEVRIVMTPAKYVEEIVVKRFRKDIKSYRVIKVENMPDWAKSSALAAQAVPGLPVKSAAARVRLEYQLDGRTIHEDFFVLLSGVEMLKCLYWSAESASSVRAEAGQLDKLEPIHQTVVRSMKIDERWFSRFMQVSQLLQDGVRQQQKQLMEINQIVKDTNDHISKTISDSYWARQKVQDKMHQQFSNIINGVDQYALPDGKSTVTLPSGYNHAWVNGAGEYVLSNNGNYNPNQRLNGTWTEVKTARPDNR